MAENFFDEPLEQPKVKTAIVAKYFKAWANVITGYQRQNKEQERIAYLDLHPRPIAKIRRDARVDAGER